MDFILLNWFAEQIAIRDRTLLLKLAGAAEADADNTVGDEAKEQVLRAVAERLRIRHAEDESIQTKALWRLLQIEDKVGPDGTCDDCGKENTTIYRSGYGAWFCFGCLVDNVVEAQEE